ncbi:MAG: TetR/AcrR family transcriptional regulator [Chloroflexota bacterium]
MVSTLPPRRRSNNRIEPLLDAAAERFAKLGYHKTTVRDVAAAVDMLPGSVYYHFPSKEQLLLAVYREGVERISARVDAALERSSEDPWARLEDALAAHLDTVLDQSDYARVLIRVLPDQLPEIAAELTELRSDYEARFTELVDALKLPRQVDRSLLRLLLLGAANWSEIWYAPGRATPAVIAKRFVTIIRQPMETTDDD